jgi:hypothetical protein
MIESKIKIIIQIFIFVWVLIFLSGCSYQDASRFDWGDDWTEHKIEIYDIAKNHGIDEPFLISRINRNDIERFNLFYTDVDNSYLGQDIFIVFGTGNNDVIEFVMIPYLEKYDISDTYTFNEQLTYIDLENFGVNHISSKFSFEDVYVYIFEDSSFMLDDGTKLVSPIVMVYDYNHIIYFTENGIVSYKRD